MQLSYYNPDIKENVWKTNIIATLYTNPAECFRRF
jgi:hypothetical protein